MNRKKRLFRQIYSSLLAMIVISVGSLGWYAVRSLDRFHLNNAMTDLETRSRILGVSILPMLTPLSSESVDRFCKAAGSDGNTRITVILPNGQVVGDSLENPDRMDNHLDRPEIRDAITGKRGIAIRHSKTLDRRMLYATTVLEQHNTPVGILRASRPLKDIDEAIQTIRRGLLGAGVIVLLIGGAVCLVLTKRITQPVEELKNGAERLAEGLLDYRFAPQEIWELDRLVDAMNHMASELQKKVETVKNQRNEYEAVLASMVEGVISLDRREHILGANWAALRILGNPKGRIKTRGIHEIVRNSEMQAFIEKASRIESMIHDDIHLRNEEQVIQVTASPLMDAGDERIGTVLILQDVTRLRRLERMRKDFVANVSHEIKTPLTAIKGFVETLRDGAIRNAEESERFLEIIDRHVNRLTDIVEDLLQLSSIERNEELRTLDLQDCRASEIIQAAASLCQNKANEKRIRIEHSSEDDFVFRADPRLMEQALANYLDNAIKYSPEEGIVRITALREGPDVMFRVTDQGVGIAHKHLPRLFERFYRVDRARSRALGGTGLGLAIVRHIAQAHGGSVSVESTPGEGSAFSIRIPEKRENG